MPTKSPFSALRVQDLEAFVPHTQAKITRVYTIPFNPYHDGQTSEGVIHYFLVASKAPALYVTMVKGHALTTDLALRWITMVTQSDIKSFAYSTFDLGFYHGVQENVHKVFGVSVTVPVPRPPGLNELLQSVSTAIAETFDEVKQEQAQKAEKARAVDDLFSDL